MLIMAIYKRKIVPLQLIMTIQDKYIELTGVKMSQTESENVTELTSDELNLSRVEAIAEKLDVHKRTVLRDIDELKKELVIERIGGDFGGEWKIIKKK